MMKTWPYRRLGSFALSIFSLLAFASCASPKYKVAQAPNYDHLIGRKFSDAIFRGRLVYKVVREKGDVEELENRRSDGCVLVIGVRKRDDIIEFVRIDSGIDTCKVRKEPHNL